MRTFLPVLVFSGALGVISAAAAQQPAPGAPPPAAPAVPPTPPPAAAPAAPAVPPPPPDAAPEAPGAPGATTTTAPTAENEESPATPPPPPPNELPPPPAASEASAACLPSCRSGYTCLRGTCVSLCNPPCGLGEFCTGAGECSARPGDPLPGDPEAARRARGFETHDGFFLRLTTGFGGGAVTLDVPDDPELTYSGGGWSSSVDIGGSPVQDLVIFGRLRGAWLIEPTLRLDDEKIDDIDGLAVNQGLLGAGLNYYIMPLNLYVGGVVGFAVVEAVQRRRNRDDESDSSEVGFGIDLDVGKEWWIDDNWGIGVALRLSLSAVPASEQLGRDAMFGSGFIAILFSATYQ